MKDRRRKRNRTSGDTPAPAQAPGVLLRKKGVWVFCSGELSPKEAEEAVERMRRARIRNLMQ